MFLNIKMKNIFRSSFLYFLNSTIVMSNKSKKVLLKLLTVSNICTQLYQNELIVKIK